MTQLRCCDCHAPFQGLTVEDAEQDCPGGSSEAQCERCHARDMGWPDEPEGELPF